MTVHIAHWFTGGKFMYKLFNTSQLAQVFKAQATQYGINCTVETTQIVSEE